MEKPLRKMQQLMTWPFKRKSMMATLLQSLLFIRKNTHSHTHTPTHTDRQTHTDTTTHTYTQASFDTEIGSNLYRPDSVFSILSHILSDIYTCKDSHTVPHTHIYTLP